MNFRMAKKNSNQSKNLLSSRLQRTKHDGKGGRYGQQAEINIVVPEDTFSTGTSSPNESVHVIQQDIYVNDTQQTNAPQGGSGNMYQPNPYQSIPQSANNQSFFQGVAQYQPQQDFSETPPAVDTSLNNFEQNTSAYPPVQNSTLADRIRQNKSEQNNPPVLNVQEFAIDAGNFGGNGDVNAKIGFTDNADVSEPRHHGREPKQPKIKQPKVPAGERVLDGRNGNPFRTQLPIWAKIVAIISIIALLVGIPQLIFRIPATIESKNIEPRLLVDTSGQKAIIDYIKVQHGTEDWDKDGLTNSVDDDIYNPDNNGDGSPDGMQSSGNINIGDIISYNNVTIEVKNTKVGFSKFMNYYVFVNHEGWVKISGETGVPYIYDKRGWSEAEYKNEYGDYIVYIPNDCYLEFVPENTTKVYCTDFLGNKVFASKESRYVKNYGAFSGVASFFLHAFLPVTEPTDNTIASIWYSDTHHIVKQNNITKADAVAPDTSLYDISIMKDYAFSYERLYEVYEKIDNQETVLISILTPDGGEATCFIYAYDYLGNFYVADARTSKTAGMIRIIPKAQIYIKDGAKYIREWYEFEGLGFSSKQDDNLFIY